MTDLELADAPEPSEEAKAFARSYFGDTYDCEYSGTISMVEEAFDAGRQSAADKLEALSGRISTANEALSAIIDRAPERDLKWAGMTPRDIAIVALAQTQSEG